jgi:hypothetical protein
LEYHEQETGIRGTLYVPHDSELTGLKALDRLRKFLYLRTLSKEKLVDLLLTDTHGEDPAEAVEEERIEPVTLP